MNKYRAKRTFSALCDRYFASRAEAQRGEELHLLEMAGEISELEYQPNFILQEGFMDNNGRHIRAIAYLGDFSYNIGDDHYVEDTKGFSTQVFKLKAKLFKYKYPNFKLVVGNEKMP